jgi:predicted GNAT family N-acyltransferase
MRSHYVPALAGILLALGLCYWLYVVERSSQVPKPRGIWSARLSGPLCFAAGLVLAWSLILLAGHWRYSVVDARVTRSGLRPKPVADDGVDTSDRNGQMILRRLEDDKAFQAIFRVAKPKREDVVQLIGRVVSAALEHGSDLPAALEALRTRRHEWQPALKALRQAQAAPHFSWNVRYSVPYYQVEIPHYYPLLKLTRIACGEALLMNADGDVTGAETLLKRAQWLTDKVMGNPDLVAAIIGASMQSRVYDAAIPLLKKGKGQKLLAGQEIGGLEHAFIRSLSRDLLLGPPSIRGNFSGILMIWGGSGQGFAGKAADLAYLPWLDWDIAARLADSVDTLPDLDGPLPQVRQCLQAFQRRAWQAGWLLQEQATPRFDDMYVQMVAVTARQEIALLCQKAVAFRRSRHRWPAGFSELPQLRELPDPFSGQPMITRIKDGHFELISVGSDGKEDGDTPAKGMAKDIVVRL